MSSLKNKVVIVTGASFGIGAATAVYFAERHSKLVLVARTEENLHQVAKDCQEKGLEKDYMKFQINNAGIGKYTPILDTKLEDFDAIMKTNIRAPFHLSQLCLPHLVKSKGASSGIGAATASYLAERGAKLSIAARNLEKLNETKENCKRKGAKSDDILTVKCDVTVEGDVEKLVKATVDKFGRIDVLVNNAGKNKYEEFLKTDLKDLDALFKTNVRAPFHVTQLCMPYLLKTKGKEQLDRSFPIAICYCMSKAAYDHMTRTLSVGSPGMTRTEFQLNSGMSEAEYKEYLSRQKQLQPLCGAVEPIEVAKAIAFFASDDSGSITGETLFIDGGRHAMAPI
ncbi:hypothetical protein FSP39_023001 [Pinctada imbricata]|uniref:Uncharacterized protein n=1 Tax=Pinctada imbricata TaxID=66713 RepID=A0AA88XNL9_PINIB|nr:hypothetical protein FSP39_023001 [Pinctada imbricata]